MRPDEQEGPPYSEARQAPTFNEELPWIPTTVVVLP